MKFVCEYCNKVFSKKIECIKCENKHLKDKKSKNFKSLAKELERILIEIQNADIEVWHMMYHNNGCGVSGTIGQYITDNGNRKFTGVSTDEKEWRIDINSFKEGDNY